MPTQTAADVDVLTELNDAYIHSVRDANVERFREILAADFLCSNPDGTLLDKPQFLAQTAATKLKQLTTEDVRIRVIGDVAIIHARTNWQTFDGRSGGGRYTDVWARRDGRWQAVSAHVTRLTA
jgi:hypothetical protein